MSAQESLVFKPGSLTVTDGICGIHNLGSAHPSNKLASALRVTEYNSFLRDHGLMGINLDAYDFFWLHIPQTVQKYKMCMIAIRRTENEYFAVTGEGNNTSELARGLMKALLSKPTPYTFRDIRLKKWFYRDINYRSTISTRDVLHLEPYKEKQ